MDEGLSHVLKQIIHKDIKDSDFKRNVCKSFYIAMSTECVI
jgi:hypothetical protein